MRETIMNDWDKITDAIKAVKDYVYGNTFLRTDKTVPSYLSLVPLIYVCYHYPNEWKQHERDFQKYLIRTSLTGVFGGNPDQLLDKITTILEDRRHFRSF